MDYALKQRSYSDRFNCKIEGCYSGLCTINKRVAVLLLAGLLATILLAAVLLLAILLVILLSSKEGLFTGEKGAYNIGERKVF